MHVSANLLDWKLTNNFFSYSQARRRCERAVGARARSCQACYNSKQKCKGAVWGATAGPIRGPRKPEADKKGSLAEAVRVLGSKMRQIRGILDVGLVEMADAMGRWMEDHRPEVLEEEWHSEEEAEVVEDVRELVEEKEALREFLKERVRLRDEVQAALAGPEGVTEAPADNEGNVVEGGIVEGGVNGDSAVISGSEPTPEN